MLLLKIMTGKPEQATSSTITALLPDMQMLALTVFEIALVNK